MAYEAIIEARREAEKGMDQVREGVRLGLQMKRDTEARKEAARAATMAAPSPHPDDLAVDRFAVAMKAKLAKKRAEGRGGWEDKDQCSAEFLSDLLREHVEKGDPVDVANLAMMLHQRDELIAAPASAAEPVKVKQLEWRNGFRPGNLVASHPFGENYVIATDHDDIRSMSRRFSSVDDAKEAVQADFEARIRSAIVTIDT